MLLNRFQKIVLGLAGLIALAIGGFILLAPHAFYASYGITLGQDPNQLSELRAPAAGLTAFGIIMLSGLARAGWAPVAIVVALTVFIAFPAGRLVSLIVDGVPSGSILGALAIEVVIAGLCLVAFAKRRPATEAARVPLSGIPG